MKKLSANMQRIFFMSLMSIGFAAICQSSQFIPGSITLNQLQNLYEPVVFEHQMHAEIFPCSSCHHHLMGAEEDESRCTKCHQQKVEQKSVVCSDCHLLKQVSPLRDKKDKEVATSVYHLDTPHLKGALHLQCVGCHRAEGGPTGCRECHPFTDQGKKRFRVKE